MRVIADSGPIDLRAGAIVAAFGVTAAGYLFGAVAGPPNREVW